MSAAQIVTDTVLSVAGVGKSFFGVPVLTGIDSSNIRSYESGRAMPNIYTLARIADALTVTPGELLDGLTLDHFEEIADRRRAG